MAGQKSVSPTPDEDLGLYQLHCRYSILEGVDMKSAADMWTEMRGKYTSRAAHMSALFERLRAAPLRSPGDGRGEQCAEAGSVEGEEQTQESVRRGRDPALTQCRLEVDRFRCQHCGFRAPSGVGSSGELTKLTEPVVEVHHVDPLHDGIRTTRIDDLVTLCPTCHRLLHAIGRTLRLDGLPLNALRDHCQMDAASNE